MKGLAWQGLVSALVTGILVSFATVNADSGYVSEKDDPSVSVSLDFAVIIEKSLNFTLHLQDNADNITSLLSGNSGQITVREESNTGNKTILPELRNSKITDPSITLSTNPQVVRQDISVADNSAGSKEQIIYTAASP